MATVFTATCDGADAGAVAVTDPGFPYSTLAVGVGSTLVYDVANKMEGTSAVRFTGGDNAFMTAKLTGLAATRRVMRRYWKLPAASSATGVVLTRLRDSAATTLASLNLNVGGNLLIRDRAVTRWTSTATYINNVPFRTVFTVDSAATTIRVDIYSGANINGTVPDETSGAQIYTAATIGQVEDGMGTAQGVGLTYTLFMDGVLDDDTADPGPIVVAAALSAGLTVSPTAGTVPFTVTATATSAGGTGTAKTYAWSWGDGATTAAQAAATATHSFTVAGTYTVVVTVTNT